MPTANVNGIDIYFETFGHSGDPTLLLVSGLGAQCVVYDEALCQQFVDQGFHVVRYDNRDVGLSTYFDDHSVDAVALFMARLAGEPVVAPYTLSDMANDGLGVLDELGVDQAHVLGTSMGGMIAQTMAIESPDRVASLASVFSTTGEPDVGTPHDTVIGALVEWVGRDAPPVTRDEKIDASLAISRVISTPATWDEVVARERHSVLVDRAYHPEGTPRQFAAILASGSRADSLGSLTMPTTVIHGDLDPLVDISGGRRTHELIPDSTFHVLEGMAHDLPTPYWGRIVDAVTVNTRRVARVASS